MTKRAPSNRLTRQQPNSAHARTSRQKNSHSKSFLTFTLEASPTAVLGTVGLAAKGLFRSNAPKTGERRRPQSTTDHARGDRHGLAGYYRTTRDGCSRHQRVDRYRSGADGARFGHAVRRGLEAGWDPGEVGRPGRGKKSRRRWSNGRACRSTDAGYSDLLSYVAAPADHSAPPSRKRW